MFFRIRLWFSLSLPPVAESHDQEIPGACHRGAGRTRRPTVTGCRHGRVYCPSTACPPPSHGRSNEGVVAGGRKWVRPHGIRAWHTLLSTQESEVSHLKTQNMNRNYRLLVSISAASVLSIPAIAKDTPGHKPAACGQLATFSQSARAADRLTSFERDAKNADLAVTARIRAGLRVGKNLSVSGRNVKIVTSGGRVVLEGAVITAQEKRLIGNIAIGVQRRENVDNRLEVRQPPPLAPTALRVVEQ